MAGAKHALALMLALAAFGTAAAELLLLPPPRLPETPAGTGKIRFPVYGLNRGAEPVPARFPATLPCSLFAGGAGIPATARLVSGTPSPTPVPAGGFAVGDYEVDWAGSGAAPDRIELRLEAEESGPDLHTPPDGRRPGPAPLPESGRPDNGGIATVNQITRLPGDRLGDRPRLNLSNYFSPYEANYFIYGPSAPTTRFQFSIKMRTIKENALPSLTDYTGLPYFAYTQTSLWDWSAPSAPFYDSSYKPELFMLRENIPLQLPLVQGWDLQYGLQHESNGKGGAESRSQNLAYVKPIFHFGEDDPDGFHLVLAPRFYAYVGDMSDNPDMPNYRGWGDLTVRMGWEDGLVLGTMFRIGERFENPTAQFDLSYPLHRLPLPWCDKAADNVYLFLQVFTGYGICLREYNESTTDIRLGLSISR